jgi:hypothetical protein
MIDLQRPTVAAVEAACRIVIITVTTGLLSHIAPTAYL